VADKPSEQGHDLVRKTRQAYLLRN
jgi:hypothetical protein